ncbi:ribosomal protein L16 [Cryptococcus bacillisporus CA1873]|uniref:Ribosomal protein L16 n=1 Tax=Cryptococcus bacillisporus CA1873 TaxID=1296111 RepID=A0ABR5BK50_CRYGA|nr:ribosomal protein L16 [Cryptococcus bacillisporus CA1873]|eukprot:KIR69220.1 ribosomal protein L16 [Cryptococcus gattii CA1873]
MLNLSIFRPTTSRPRLALSLPTFLAPKNPTQGVQQVRFRGQLAPKRTKYRKASKGAPGGGSLKGTALHHGTFGLRACSSVRLSAAQLTSCQAAVRRKIKPIKGAQFYLRVFPDIPVCVKGNEQRMGKGKGSFEYWSCRVKPGKVIMEVGGGDIREEIAKAALKLAQARLPLQTEFITLSSSPRLGRIATPALADPPSAQPIPNNLAYLDAKEEGGARRVIMRREERAVEEIVDGLRGLEVKNAAKGIDG